MSKIDYETLRIRSRKANRRLAEYIRETALQTEPPIAHTTVDASIFRNLAGVANRSNSVRLQGKNLNQLTKLTHQTSLYRTNYRLKEVLDGVMEIIRSALPLALARTTTDKKRRKDRQHDSKDCKGSLLQGLRPVCNW